MCNSADNSLEVNLAALDEMLRMGIADLSDMPRLKMEAENAERIHRTLIKQIALTPEDIFRLTAYRINASPDPLQIR
jgi:hypothetical protein